MKQKEERDLSSFQSFAQSVISKKADIRYRMNNIHYTTEEINDILNSNCQQEIAKLSRYYAASNSTYSQPLEYYASLLNYKFVLIPHYTSDKPPAKLKLQYTRMMQYLQKLNLQYNLQKINYIILTEGAYCGVLMEKNGTPFFYQLPQEYCRYRYEDEYGFPILELSTSYFLSVSDNDLERSEVLKLFPEYVQNIVVSGKKAWIEIPFSEGGLFFFFKSNLMPPFADSIKTIDELDNAIKRESLRDAKELAKILVHQLPIDKSDGTLIFSMEEAQALHDSLCNMLMDEETIDIVTTFGTIKLEDVQSTLTSATNSSSRLDKYRTNVYNNFGIAEDLFNSSDAATALTYSIKKDISIMFKWSQQYQIAINKILLNKSKKNNLFFTIKFLPTTTIFQKEENDLYLKNAQYGLPAFYPAAALGLDSYELEQLSVLENEVLNLKSKMIPLSSSYTISAEEKISNSEKKSEKGSQKNVIDTEGGRPQKNITERSDSTNNNIDGAT